MARHATRILFATLLFSAPAQANDGAFHGNGATVFAYKEHRIQMVSEHIRIRHAPPEGTPISALVPFENSSLSLMTLASKMSVQITYK